MNSRSPEQPRPPHDRARPAGEQGRDEYTSRAKRAYTSRRPRSPHYEVRHLPPPWKRSLTESAMHRKLTRLDVAAVLLFLLGFVGLAVWVIQSGYA